MVLFLKPSMIKPRIVYSCSATAVFLLLIVWLLLWFFCISHWLLFIAKPWLPWYLVAVETSFYALHHRLYTLQKSFSLYTSFLYPMPKKYTFPTYDLNHFSQFNTMFRLYT